MPNIRQISDLRNYTEVLKEMRTNQPVYLTRNGKGAYIEEGEDYWDKMDKQEQDFYDTIGKRRYYKD